MSEPFGKNILLTIEGCAHDAQIKMTLSGLPEGIKTDFAELKAFLDRRSPTAHWETARKESDKPVFLSGIKNGATDGNDIIAIIENKNTDSSVYSDVKRFPRPSHADYPAVVKYGKAVDLRGGGHFSGRLTVLTCVAGFIAKEYLKTVGIDIFAHIYSINNIYDKPFDTVSPVNPEFSGNTFPALDSNAGERMQKAALEARERGDSLGGCIECAITGIKAGFGEHMFNSVEAGISDAVFSIPSVKGIEFGAGFEGTKLSGSEYNDEYRYRNGEVVTITNNSGGILGGMTDGMPVIFRAAIKPVPSISLPQKTVDLEEKKDAEITINGRHDSCIVPRAVPVVEAAAALALADIVIGEKKAEALGELRREIDITDKKIAVLLNKRNELSRQVGIVKKSQGTAVFDGRREEKLLERIAALAGEENSEFAVRIYGEILACSKEIQNRIIENG